MQIFPPAPECPICLVAYEWDTRTQQPVALACGHSYCRACLCRLTSKRCPTCGKAFLGHVMTMAPNHALGDMMAAMTEFEVRRAGPSVMIVITSLLPHHPFLCMCHLFACCQCSLEIMIILNEVGLQVSASLLRAK